MQTDTLPGCRDRSELSVIAFLPAAAHIQSTLARIVCMPEREREREREDTEKK